MLARLRKHKKAVSFVLLFTITQGIFLDSAKALTSGPSQPETQQFAPAGMDNLVDPFSGDFSYNIPLMDVGGYPVNLNYASGITPDAEASWVGLGWNLNVGAINRNMRGLPDDFAGEEVKKEYHTKPNQTFGVTGNIQLEAYGAELKKVGAQLGLSANLFYNTYNGFGMSMGASPSISSGNASKSKFTGSLGLAGTLGSESGLEVSPKLGLSFKQGTDNSETTLSSSISFPFSTREGLKGMTLQGSASVGVNTTRKNETTGAIEGGGGGGGVSSTAYQGFAATTYMPSLEHSTYNVNASLNLSFSPSDPVTDGFPFGFGGYYSGQFLKEASKSTPAFGYMYSGLSQSDDKLMDFNREKDASYNEYTKNLALTNFTYDVFQVSGQGVGGAYRLYRGDVGAVHDPASTDVGYSPSLGVDIGIGSPPSSKFGIDGSYNQSNTYSGKWQDGRNGISNFSSENATQLNSPKKEMAYFKRMGEMATENDLSFYNNVQGSNKMLHHELGGSNEFFGDGQLTGNYYNEGAYVKKQIGPFPFYDFSTAPVDVNGQRNERRVRSTPFTTLTAEEARVSNIRPIQNYDMEHTWYNKDDDYRSLLSSNAEVGYKSSELLRIDGNKKAHHISEIRVTDNTGARYIYGIPAYNTYQEELTFASNAGNNSNVQSGMIKYSAGDDSPSNDNGLDHMYSKTITPPYAHSYLLTNVLSTDYVDRDDVAGPSDGDLGTYTKFNYTRAIEKFKWRTPYSRNGFDASYTQGMQGSDDDDKANYVYGEKEIWYLHSIETRTHVAEFYLKPREDARGVVDKNGVIGGDKQMYLDKIVLYSKPDKLNGKAEPIKTVHFEYDYSLCPGTPNSNGGSNQGKLTLKKVWFTYGKSQKGVLNPYVFNYARQNFTGDPAIDKNPEADLNPSYSFKNYDRWGNYKKDDLTVGNSNAEFPYVNQDKAVTDRYAAVYALSRVQTPTGGELRVYYESDDYAYVQNRQAMRMFKVIAACKNDHTAQNEDFYDFFTGINAKNTLVVDLGEGFTPSTGNHDVEFRKKYLDGIDKMYYKFYTRVLGALGRSEFVPGYAEMDVANSSLDASTKSGSKYTRAFIRLKAAEVTYTFGIKTDVNPIVRNGWMFARLNLNRELMGSGNANDNGLEQVLRSLFSMAKTMVQLFDGFGKKMHEEFNSSSFEADRSFVRLNEPDKMKLGGGHRVKAVVMVDNWGAMKGQKEGTSTTKETAMYGQKYNYTMQENGVEISSGVAAYEPMVGGEENPFRQPVFTVEKIPMAPDKEYFSEEPFGESFFPSPSVGYREVVVTPIKVTNANTFNVNSLTGNGTGYVKHEFYTAYEFPTIVRQSTLEVKRHKPNILFKFMKFDSKDLVTCTQGYYVELNDMHGKQHRNTVYPEIAAGSTAAERMPVSEVEYTYKTTNGRLNNNVNFINSDLSITREGNGPEMGVDVDVVQDERFYESTTIGGGAAFNLKWVQYGPIPTFIPTLFPDFSTETTRFRSVVTTKVLNRYAVQETTIAKDNGASITTKNLAWDNKTGQVLLTETQNEFHDPIYSFTYPGHWAYERMALASENEGMVFTSKNAVLNALKDGDELALLGNASPIAFVDKEKNLLIDAKGKDVGTFTKAKVVRSGARNIAATPVGSVVTLENPIKAGNTYLSFDKVLNAGVNEYKEDWQRFCNCGVYEASKDKSANVFVLGRRGNIRPLRNWTYLTNRTQTTLNNNVNVRHDGVFADFTPFWKYYTVSGASKSMLNPMPTLPSTKWQFITQIEKYNPVGMAIEEQDALNRFSMALYGYGRNLQVAGSNNSQYRETGFDGFEDYDFGDCEDDHMSWRALYKSNVTNEQAHTGRKSIRVPKNDSLKINKVIVPCDIVAPSND
ncbi:MAG: hypothetical protein NT150_01855 [Bacteroidetes bacterium]|nr:hypothetical protein [Bacteroidota bacterium]